MAHDLPPERAFSIYRKALAGGDPLLRARALKAIAETKEIATSAPARGLALAALKDEDEETRIQALAILEQAPDEALVTHLLELARSGGAGRVVTAAFASLERLLPSAKGDHTREILSLLGRRPRAGPQGRPRARRADSGRRPRPPVPPGLRGDVRLDPRPGARDASSRGIPGFVPALLKLAESRRSGARRARAGSSPSSSTTPGPCPVWLKLVEERDWWIRARALENIGRHGRGDEVLQTGPRAS